MPYAFDSPITTRRLTGLARRSLLIIVCLSPGLSSHLIAPMVIPLVIWRWKTRKNKRVGMVAMDNPAKIMFHATSYWPRNDTMPTGKVRTSGLFMST